MIRRKFLRAIAVTSALVALSTDESAALAEGTRRGTSDDFLRMNDHLWQVYRLARAKGSVYPIVHDQLATLNDTLDGQPEVEARSLCRAAGDLFQLAGELAFDGNRYTDAAASYTLAASAGKEAKSYDLWACALVRHAYVDLIEHRYADAAGALSAAEKVARRGDSSLSTRHWVASVQAEAYAGLGDLSACERSLDEAEKVTDLNGPVQKGGWLRFHGSRLAEERGARYLQLGRVGPRREGAQHCSLPGPTRPRSVLPASRRGPDRPRVHRCEAPGPGPGHGLRPGGAAPRPSNLLRLRRP
ncbi:transcriptional regulator [Streptomyces prunicolor]